MLKSARMTPTNPRAIAFAALLAKRLQEVVPEGFIVKAEGDWVTVCAADDEDMTTSTGVGGIMRDHEGDVESATWAVLSSVQDFVSEGLKEPWPGARSVPRRFFQPEVAVEGSTLHMWFGDRNQPTLAVSDIDLTELR